jgi:hypothetical protein
MSLSVPLQYYVATCKSNTTQLIIPDANDVSEV